VTLAEENGTYVITEIDAPQDGGGRCKCMCVFDFALTVDALSGLVPIQIVRDTTDDNEPAKTVFSGTIDLTQDSGAIVIDPTSAGGFCNEP